MIFVLLIPNFLLLAQLPDDIVETRIPNGWVAKKSKIQLSYKHFKLGKQSVEWQWSKPNATLVISDSAFRSVADNKRSTFVVWIYNPTPVKDSLLFNFGSQRKVQTKFTLGLNFSGWRTAWLMYDRDMQGTPEKSMSQLTIHAPKSLKKGTLYIDGIQYNATINPRSPMKDVLLPFVNPNVEQEANAHWCSLYAFANNTFPSAVAKEISPAHLDDIQKIKERYLLYLKDSKPLKQKYSLETLEEEYNRWQIVRTKDKIIGNPIYSMNDAELVKGSVNGKNVKLPFDIAQYAKLMLQIAAQYSKETNVDHQQKLSQWFTDMLYHLDDQGWAYGSGMGSLHHLGYSFQPFYTACLLMKDEIKKAGLLPRTWKTMYWYSGLGRTYSIDLKKAPSNIDVLNTLLASMFETVLMIDDVKECATAMAQFSHWFSANLLPDNSITAPFKVDGAVFHHGTLYPAYAIGGFEGATPIVYMLSNTQYRVSEEAHHTLRRSLYMMYLYTHPYRWTLSLSGRHPTGIFKTSIAPFAYMAKAGLPNDNSQLDTTMAAIYLMLNKNKKDAWTESFRKLGIAPIAQYPSGHWSMNYGLLDLHRRKDWLLATRGHNRYFVTHESYPNANVFGRYLTYGQVELLYPDRDDYDGSNFKDEGWDWAHIPGTTAPYLSLDGMRADIKNVDNFSGVEEMLLSSEKFAGAVQMDGQGVFAMQLRGHEKYNTEKFSANKSVFSFDSVIVCLGSDIQQPSIDVPVHTTLFQNFNPDAKDALRINRAVREGPFVFQHRGKESLALKDNRGVGYYMPNGQNVVVQTIEQFSRDQKDLKDTKGIFSTAYIDHPKESLSNGYEYVMFIDSTANAFENFCAVMQSSKPLYTVLRKDSIAHCVYYAPDNMTATAIFATNTLLTDSLLMENDRPLLAIYKKHKDTISLNVVDPDMAFYTGPDDAPIDEYGRRKEVSIYSKPWYKTPAQPTTIQLKIKGQWHVRGVQAVNTSDGNMLLSIPCAYGLPVAITLFR